MVRYWAARLLGDAKKLAAVSREPLVKLAQSEREVEVRTQLASTARRGPAADALPILRELLLRGEDATDKLQPLLLWWAIESKCAADRDAILALLTESPIWSAPIFRQTIASRLGQRFTAERSEANLATCAR